MKAVCDKYRSQLKTLQVTVSNLQDDIDSKNYLSPHRRDIMYMDLELAIQESYMIRIFIFELIQLQDK